MKLLMIYDETSKVKKLEELSVITETPWNMLKYFIQEDIHDYHVFRVLKGSYEDECENREDAITVEYQKINKSQLCDYMGKSVKDRKSRDYAIQNTRESTLIEKIIAFDNEDGYTNYRYDVVFSMEGAMNLITDNGIYRLNVVQE